MDVQSVTDRTIYPIVAFAFAIQCIAIRGTNLGLDGGLSLALGIIPVRDALSFLAHDVHPPLYYLALRGWLAFVGAHPFTVKFFTVIFSTLSVVAFGSWLSRFVSPRAALRGSLLLALSPILVGDAATVRDLAPGLFFLVVNSWAYCEVRRNPLSRWWTSVYLASGITAIWTSFLAVGVLVGQALHLALTRGKGTLFRLLCLIGVSIVPWIVFALTQGWLTTLLSGGPTTGATRPSFLASLRMALGLLVTGSDATRGWVLAFCLLALAVTLVRGSGASVGSNLDFNLDESASRAVFSRFLPNILLAGPPGLDVLRCETFVIVELAVTMGFALGVTSAWLKLDVPSRYLAPVLPFWLLLIVSLAEQVKSRTRAWAAVALLAMINVVNLIGWYRQPTLPPSFWNPSSVQRFLDERLRPHDHAVFLTLEQAGYYSALSSHPHAWVAIPVGTSYLERNASAIASQKLRPLLRSPGTIWLVEYHGVLGSGQRAVDEWLERQAYPLASSTLSDSDVHPYLTGASLGPDRIVDARFADDVTLAGAAFPSAVPPGGSIPVRLTWHSDHPLARDLTVFVHLVDAHGQTVAQQDARPVGGQIPTTRWRGIVDDHHGMTIPAGTPPGDYWLDVGLYDGSGRLAVLGRGDGTVRLGPLSIQR
jgi:hypothetical protein